MNRTVFYQRMHRLKGDMARLQNVICAYETTDAARYPENFENLGMDAAMKAEAIACSMRNIASVFPANSRNKVLNTVADAQGIEVRKKEHGYEIVMPWLMPKRNGRNQVEFILEPLSYALEQFISGYPVERLEQALIWFIYEYSEETPARHVRDYDNIEAKEVLDVINAFFLVDDGGDFCQLHYSTRRGKRDCTRVIISENIGLFACPKTAAN